MQGAERQQKISQLVKEQGFVSLQWLLRQVNASESTIRRDLDQLEKDGILDRTHGGASYRGPAPMLGLEERLHVAADAKKQIARASSNLIRDGQTVILNGGSTTYFVAGQLAQRHLQVVTNSLPIATLLAGAAGTEMILIGGSLYRPTAVTLGPMAVRMIEQLHCELLIMGAAGLTENGLYNANVLLVEIDRAMIQSAARVAVVLDSSKIGRPAISHMVGWDEIDVLITDSNVTAEHRKMIEAHDIELVVASEA